MATTEIEIDEERIEQNEQVSASARVALDRARLSLGERLPRPWNHQRVTVRRHRRGARQGPLRVRRGVMDGGTAFGPAATPDDSPGFGGDLDGDGQSELLIVLPSGGSGGYTTSVLYAIGPSSLVPKAVLNNVWFEDEDHNGTFEAVGFDACFAYVWTSGAGST